MIGFNPGPSFVLFYGFMSRFFVFGLYLFRVLFFFFSGSGRGRCWGVYIPVVLYPSRHCFCPVSGSWGRRKRGKYEGEARKGAKGEVKVRIIRWRKLWVGACIYGMCGIPWVHRSLVGLPDRNGMESCFSPLYVHFTCLCFLLGISRGRWICLGSLFARVGCLKRHVWRPLGELCLVDLTE